MYKNNRLPVTERNMLLISPADLLRLGAVYSGNFPDGHVPCMWLLLLWQLLITIGNRELFSYKTNSEMTNQINNDWHCICYFCGHKFKGACFPKFQTATDSYDLMFHRHVIYNLQWPSLNISSWVGGGDGLASVEKMQWCCMMPKTSLAIHLSSHEKARVLTEGALIPSLHSTHTM